MLPISDALSRILAPLIPLGTEIVTLAEAHNRILAQDFVATADNPAQTVSAMDGYALAQRDLPAAPFPCIGTSAPGQPFSGPLPSGTCVRIFTGSRLPDGADTILIQENAQIDSQGAITPTASTPPDRFIRPQGQDFSIGTPVLTAGTRLTARDIGLAAAAGAVWLTVHRRPRVAILTMGDELAMPGLPLPPAGTRNSNALMMAALARACGAEPWLLPPLPDHRDAIANGLKTAHSADLTVSIGGASVGAPDLLKDALSLAEYSLDFWKIAMRPGKPLLFATHPNATLLGFPGNPVSAFVCGLRFLLPAVSRLSGLKSVELPTETAILGADIPANDHRADHLRARLHIQDGNPIVTPHTRQDSAMIGTLAASDALILRAPLEPAASSGTSCRIVRLNAYGF